MHGVAKMSVKFAIVSLLLLGLSSCTVSGREKVLPKNGKQAYIVRENLIPGTVLEPWSEPMFEQVKVPGALDPEGTYYRVPHDEIMEIRPGRVQMQEYPD